MREYLFVYGTLRKNYRLALTKRIAKDWIYIGTAKTRAALYDLGSYPGAIPGGRGELIGDVYRLDNRDRALAILDKYEGIPAGRPDKGEFVRTKTTVTLRSGTKLRAWVYWYNLDPGDKEPLRYKDYLNYLKHKRTI